MTENRGLLNKFALIISFILMSCKQSQPAQIQGVTPKEDCELRLYNSELLGEYKICQSNSDEKEIKIQFNNPNIEKKYCFIPNYLNKHSKKAIYIGEPRCQFVKFPNKPINISFFKNRRSPQIEEDYSKFPLNSVMILIDEVHSFPPPYEFPISTVEAYLKCFEFIDSLEDSAYCQAFKEMKLYTFHLFLP